MRKRLVEWRDSLVAVCVKGVTGVSPFFAYREREGQSAIDTDPGDTIKTQGYCLSHALLERHSGRFNLKVTPTL